MKTSKKIKNWQYIDLGRVVAEQDNNLQEYYVSPDKYVNRAIDLNDHAVFYVGPKGIGKSAILQMVRLIMAKDSNRIINITPESLAFSALANIEITSPILEIIGKQKWFFKAIWDYLLAVEILRREYSNQSFLRHSWGRIYKSPFEKKANRLIELSLNDEGLPVNLISTITSLLDSIEFSAEYESAKVAANIKPDKSKEAKNNLELFGVINSVAKDAYANIKHTYYIIIDDLDLNWKNDPVQNEFISGLFQSLKNFSRPPHIKCLVSMREDIFKNVLVQDRDKLHDWICNVKWDYNEIKEMTTVRIHKKTGVSRNLIWGILFPENAFDIIFKHTQGKPREVIRLTHLCLEKTKADGRNQINHDDMINALRAFSEEKIEDLASEKSYLYPGLKMALIRFLGWDKEFSFEYFSSKYVEMVAYEIQCNEGAALKYSWAGGYEKNPKGLALVFLELGFFMIKTDRKSKPIQYETNNPIDINEETWFAIHPMYHYGLGLKNL